MAANLPWLISNPSHSPYALSDINPRKMVQFREDHLRNILYGKFCDVLGDQKRQLTPGSHLYQCRGYRFIVQSDDCKSDRYYIS